MAEKDRISSFIQQLYGEDRNRTFSKQDIVVRAGSGSFPVDVEVFFEALPEQDYDETDLIDTLNAIIIRRNRMKAVGGKIEL